MTPNSHQLTSSPASFNSRYREAQEPAQDSQRNPGPQEGQGPLLGQTLAVDAAGHIAPPPGYAAADLHCHSDRSDGVRPVTELLRTAADRGLSALAVTDHDMIGGALLARDHAQNFKVEVVVGQEVTTRGQHHIVGLFLEKAVPMFRTVPETVRIIRGQGGLAVVAHPFLGVPASASEGALCRWLEQTTFDGIELESRYLGKKARDALMEFYSAHADVLGAAVGGTDAHFGEVGRVVTLYPGSGVEDLLRAIAERSTIVARTSIRHPAPSLFDHLRNQRRSLLWLPAYRLRALVTGRYS